MSRFEGFGDDALAFLAELALNNERDWFEANKSRYKDGLIEPAKAFVSALGEQFAHIAPDVQAQARVNGSIFRQNRDVRFSKDKTPYKTDLDMWFWSGDKRGRDSPGFYFRVNAERLILGAGMHRFDKRLLGAWREAVAEDAAGAALEDIITSMQSLGYSVGNEHYKRVPKPWDADHPRATLLKFNGFTATWEGPTPDAVRSSELVDLVADHYRGMLDVHTWLKDLVRRSA